MQAACTYQEKTMKVKTNLRAGAGGASGVGQNSKGLPASTDTTVSGKNGVGKAAEAAAAAAAAAAYYASPEYQAILAAQAAAYAAQMAYYASPEYQAYLATLPARCVGA
jgi:hypothetical protein